MLSVRKIAYRVRVLFRLRLQERHVLEVHMHVVQPLVEVVACDSAVYQW
jgi:hypothetical protein